MQLFVTQADGTRRPLEWGKVVIPDPFSHHSPLAAIDDNAGTGWGINELNKRNDHIGVFTLRNSVDLADEESLLLEISCHSFWPCHVLGRVRLSVTEGKMPNVDWNDTERLIEPFKSKLI